MIQPLFVTGTGTDIGKTFVTCGLLSAWSSPWDGTRRGLKPVASGFDPLNPAASDAGQILTAQGIAPTLDAVARISPWRFAAPLSPDQAAAREHRTIDLADLLAFCRAEAEKSPVLVEGVGGVMVPLNHHATTLDWMAGLGWPVLLVTGAYLGTLSHTLTALDALAHRGLTVAALVVNTRDAGTVPIADTLATLRRFAPAPPIISLPENADAMAFREVAACIGAARQV